CLSFHLMISRIAPAKSPSSPPQQAARICAVQVRGLSSQKRRKSQEWRLALRTAFIFISKRFNGVWPPW
ncbi:MAG: hypothetical protein ACRD06_05375, partial [Terriglobia bacterium]